MEEEIILWRAPDTSARHGYIQYYVWDGGW